MLSTQRGLKYAGVSTKKRPASNKFEKYWVCQRRRIRLNPIGEPTIGRLISWPSVAHVLCVLVVCTPSAFIVVRRSVGQWISPLHPWDIRHPGKRLGRIFRIGSNLWMSKETKTFVISFQIWNTYCLHLFWQRKRCGRHVEPRPPSASANKVAPWSAYRCYHLHAQPAVWKWPFQHLWSFTVDRCSVRSQSVRLAECTCRAFLLEPGVVALFLFGQAKPTKNEAKNNLAMTLRLI